MLVVCLFSFYSGVWSQGAPQNVSFRSIHWVAPTTMVVAFLSGCLLIMGHSLFYSKLSGQPIPTGSYSFAGTTLNKQQFNTSVGTAFAFLVKNLLAVAITTA